jgi:hypothetical protein
MTTSTRTTQSGRGRDAASRTASKEVVPVTAPAVSEDARTEHRHRDATQHAIRANTTHLDLRLGGVHAHLELPPVDKLAFYAGLAGAAAFGVIEWPIALVAGVGHLLSDDRRNRTLRALGEALDAV